ncbi:sigma 54-interacting transcriptional regulator [Clostridiaceae bacterium 35-E11]
MESYIQEVLKIVLKNIDEGVHVIDTNGKTIIYNEAMTEMEGLEKKDVIGKPFLDIFPTLDENNSTLLRVLRTEERLINRSQTYFNNRNQEITSINTTLPIFIDGEKIGALEIAKNITKIKKLSDQIISIQKQLSQPGNNKKLSKNYTFDSIIGKSKNFIKAIQYAKKATKSSSSVLIYGETGTGKELVAQSIHYGSDRRDQPFIAQNCAAIPETLLEGIIFGTVKGSFTGAIDRPGLFEQASGGTIFLDEINSMGMQLQSKLLRVLQERSVRRIGGLKDTPIDIRIIASTNEEPYKAMESGKIRRDLFYRLNVISVVLPPLRERKEDIKILTDYFINKYNKMLNKEIKGIDASVREAFSNYQWMGNVRELENIIEGVVNIVENEEILIKEHFPPNISAKIFTLSPKRDYKFKKSLSYILEEIEKDFINETLERCNYNISRTAKELGMKRQTLQHKLKKIDIQIK